MELSIIIPIYNAEKFLEQCLNSVKNIKNIDFECLMVDDGSTDRSKDICEKYVNERFKYIFKENSGVSSTRNYGIKKAQGKYIIFLDADDYLNDDIEEILIDAINSKSDFVIFDYKIDLDGKEIHKRYIKQKEDLLEDVIYKMYSTSELNTCWGKLFKSNIIKGNGLKFYEDIKIGEDKIFVMEYINFIKQPIYFSCEILTYRINKLSVMNNYNPNDRWIDFKRCYSKMKDTNIANKSEYILQEMKISLLKEITYHFRHISTYVSINNYLKIYLYQVNDDITKEVISGVKNLSNMNLIKRVELSLIKKKSILGGIYFFVKGKLNSKL